MTGFLRLTHEQRKQASQMPGVAAWVWFEILAWNGKPIQRGQLLDASGCESLKTVDRALMWLENAGLVVKSGHGWIPTPRQTRDSNGDTEKTVMETPRRHQGDSNGDTEETKLSTPNENKAVIDESGDLAKERKKERKKETNTLLSTSVLSVNGIGETKTTAAEILKLENLAKPTLSQLEGKERYWLGQLSSSVEGRVVGFGLLVHGVEVFRSLLEFQNLTSAAPATLREWARALVLHLEQHGSDKVLEAMRITLAQPLEKKSGAWKFFERVLISERIEVTPFVPLEQQMRQSETQATEPQLSPFAQLLKDLEETS